jgi:hypothetical protein
MYIQYDHGEPGIEISTAADKMAAKDKAFILPPVKFPDNPTEFHYLVGDLEIAPFEVASEILKANGIKFSKTDLPKGTPFYKHRITLSSPPVKPSISDKASMMATQLSLFLYLAERAALMPASDYITKKFVIYAHPGTDKLPPVSQPDYDGIRFDFSNANNYDETATIRWVFSLTTFGHRSVKVVYGDIYTGDVVPYARAFLGNGDIINQDHSDESKSQDLNHVMFT